MKQRTDVLIACDLNQSRPWFRDRIPAIDQAIGEVDAKCGTIDIYGLLGQHKYMPTNTEERKVFLQTANIVEINKNFEREIVSKNPKVLVLSTADNFVEFLLPSTVANIRKNGIFVVGTLGDDEFTYPQYRFLLGWFDLFIAYVKPCVEYYENFGLSKGYYLPNSCFLDNRDFSDHFEETEFDAVLVGSPTANRPEMVEALLDAGLNIAIYGSKQWEGYDFVKDHYFGYVATEEFDDVLKKGKIVLAFLEDHLTGNLHMNTKIWEAVRVARLPVVTYYDRLIEDYKLTEGVDVVMYRDTAELVEKVKYYANNQSERLRVSEALYQKVESEFDYALMYERLFSYLATLSIDVKGDDGACVVSELNDNNQNVTYFPSASSVVDREVLNHVHIIKVLNKSDQKIDWAYFDRVENGLRTISRWPFINLDSIVFFSENKKLNKFELIRALFFGNSIHIKQFCIVSEKKSVFGMLNRFLDRCLYGKNEALFRKIKQSYDSYKRKK